MKPIHWMAAVALAASALTTAWAGPVGREVGPNLITNGGFENTSSIAGSGFTTSGFFLENFDYFVDTSAADAHGGTHSFAGGGIDAPGFLSQSFTTIVGRSYNIHFWLANLSGFSDGTEVQVLWNNLVVYSASDITNTRYVEIVIDPLATSTTTTLSIGLRDDNFLLNIDDISVRAIPEPAELALFAAGLAAVLVGRRRRTRR